jgi:nitrate reductase delta subunit
MKRQVASAVFGCASVLLSYPEEESFSADLAAVEGALRRLPAGSARSHLESCWRWLSSLTAMGAATAYVEAFDLRRRRSLYLTYYRHGDTRERGMALAALVGAYKAAGFMLAPGELPDFLPALLELAASHPDGQALLSEHRPALSALRAGLEEAGSSFAGAVAAVTGALGPLDRAGRAALSRYREQGPPSERVGLEPFAPPEVVLPTDGAAAAFSPK